VVLVEVGETERSVIRTEWIPEVEADQEVVLAVAFAFWGKRKAVSTLRPA
jgi:hypothetical protein